MVPVDYVTDAIFPLTAAGTGATLHLTAGRNASSVAELVEMGSAFFGRSAPRLVDPALYRRMVRPVLVRTSRDERLRRALRRSQVYFPTSPRACATTTAAPAHAHRRASSAAPARLLRHARGLPRRPARAGELTRASAALGTDPCCGGCTLVVAPLAVGHPRATVFA